LIIEHATGKRFPQYALECLRLDAQTPCFKPIPLNGPSPNPHAVWALSNDLHLAAISSEPKKINIYDTTRATVRQTIQLSAPRYLRNLSFLRNDSLLIAAFDESKLGIGGISIWDIGSGMLVQALDEMPVVQMSVSPDRRTLLIITRSELLFYAVAAK
jgi:hypothetical protein